MSMKRFVKQKADLELGASAVVQYLHKKRVEEMSRTVTGKIACRNGSLNGNKSNQAGSFNECVLCGYESRLGPRASGDDM